MCIVLWLIFTDWTRIWLSWQPGLCNRQKAGSEGHRRTALLHESQCVSTSSVYYCCQVESFQTPPVSAVGHTGAKSVWRCESPKMKLQLIVKSKLAEMHLVFSPPCPLCYYHLLLRAFVKEDVSLLLTHAVPSCLLYQCLLYLAVGFCLLLWFLGGALAASSLSRQKQGICRIIALTSTFLSKWLLRLPNALVFSSQWCA